MAVFLLLVVDLAIVGALVYTLEPLITLLRRNEELFTPTVTLPLNGTASASYYSGDLGRQKIPRILHQTTANSTIPAKWIKPQQSCQETYSDFEYKVSRVGTDGQTDGQTDYNMEEKGAVPCRLCFLVRGARLQTVWNRR